MTYCSVCFCLFIEILWWRMQCCMHECLTSPGNKDFRRQQLPNSIALDGRESTGEWQCFCNIHFIYKPTSRAHQWRLNALLQAQDCRIANSVVPKATSSNSSKLCLELKFCFSVPQSDSHFQASSNCSFFHSYCFTPPSAVSLFSSFWKMAHPTVIQEALERHWQSSSRGMWSFRSTGPSSCWALKISTAPTVNRSKKQIVSQKCCQTGVM